jgi:hypothetical protein
MEAVFSGVRHEPSLTNIVTRSDRLRQKEDPWSSLPLSGTTHVVPCESCTAIAHIESGTNTLP